MHCLEKLKEKRGIEDNRGQINIRGFARATKARYKSSKSVLKKIMNIKQMKTDWIFSKILNRALNEGITEWMKQKGIKGYETYNKEVNIVDQIENIIGASPIVEIVNRNPKEMNTLLNMNKNEFLSFCNEMYYIYFLDELKDKMEDSIVGDGKFGKIIEFNQGEGKYINEEIEKSTIKVQIQLIEKLIIPYFEKEHKHTEDTFNKSVQCMNLIMNYCNNAYAYTDVFSNLRETEQFKKLQTLLDNEIVQYAIQNIESIDKWYREKIFEIDKKMCSYGYIHFDIFDDNYDTYVNFTQKLSASVERERLREDTEILNKVKQDLDSKEKIDVKILVNDYVSEYSSFNIGDKVRELVLNKKMTDRQHTDLLKEVFVYLECGKVISKKDIKKYKNEDGKLVYYVMVNGEKYEDEYLKTIKSGRKFLSSKKYEVVSAEKDNNGKENQSENNDSKDTALITMDEKKHGKIENIITKLKKWFSNKKSDTTVETADSPDKAFKERIKVEANTTRYQAKKKVEHKTINQQER